MKSATISFTKNHLSELLAEVRRGETVTILDRTRPVARLVPVPATGDDDLDRRLGELERQGIIRRGTGRVPKWILKERPPKTRSGWSAVDAVIEDRRGRP